MSLALLVLHLMLTGAGSPRIDHIVIRKSQHTLTTYSQGKVLRVYKVALGRSSGPKQSQGDHRTPEGHYVVDGLNAKSRFHLALHLSYPNEQDRRTAAARHVSPGSDVEIHGVLPAISRLGHLQSLLDWTDGCIALTNTEIEELYAQTRIGTPVEIEP